MATFARYKMSIFTNINKLPDFRNAVLTIGTFDGVHLGHKAILQQVVARAKEVGGESILITFEPHPRKLLFPGQPLKLLTPLDQKLQLISQAGIQHIIVAPFTHEFAALSAQDYIRDFLVKRFQPSVIVIGYDHHFGHDRTGNIELLKQYEQEYGYKVVEIPAQLIDEAAVSSTKIRNAITAGHVKEAAHMLGRNYSISGTVIKGAQLGKPLGYPTANIELKETDQLIPAIGIYATHAIWNGKRYSSMSSIGYNPTVSDEKKLHIETNIFDFDKTIYGETLDVEFAAWLRNEEKFDSLEQLKQQLHKDKENCLNLNL